MPTCLLPVISLAMRISSAQTIIFIFGAQSPAEAMAGLIAALLDSKARLEPADRRDQREIRVHLVRPAWPALPEALAAAGQPVQRVMTAQTDLQAQQAFQVQPAQAERAPLARPALRDRHQTSLVQLAPPAQQEPRRAFMII